MSYAKLDKDPASLAGTVITGQVQVSQYDSVTGTSAFLGDVTNVGYGFWTGHVLFDVDPAAGTKVCKDTVLTYWGEVVGPYSYTNTIGGQTTVPEVNIRFLTVQSGSC